MNIIAWQASTILNAHLAHGGKDTFAVRIYAEPLADFDPDGQLVPILAREIPSLENGDVAADGTSGTWRLRENVVRHDGEAFTADNFVFTWQYVTDPDVSTSTAGNYATVESVEALREHRRRQVEERLKFPGEWEMPDLVFATTWGSPIDPGSISKGFKRTLKGLGVPAARFHDLRHTAATLLLQAGTHPRVVSEILGHSTIVLTLDTYSNVIPAMHEAAADALEQMLRSASWLLLGP